MNLKKYSKAIVAVLGALSVALSDGIVDTSEGVTVVLALLTALGVYAVPNADAGLPEGE
jgi:tellurite resistance protein